MTESEAKEMLKASLECDKRKNKVAYEEQCHEDCDNCELCYAQGTAGQHKEVLQMAINALEKQIPKKVKIEQWIYTKCDCGYEFSKHHEDGYYSIPYEKKTKYCPNCGQKLDWSDEE